MTKAMHASQTPKGRATHASGWTLRGRKRNATPAHELPMTHGIRHFRGIMAVLGSALVVALGVFAGTSYAYFSSSGTGSGHATIGTLKALTITAGVPASALVPGGTADLALTVTNPNGAVTMTGITSGAGTVTVSGGTGCTKTNAHVAVVTQTGLSLPLSTGHNTVHISGGASMTTTSATGCQNASFTIPVKVSVKQ